MRLNYLDFIKPDLTECAGELLLKKSSPKIKLVSNDLKTLINFFIFFLQLVQLTVVYRRHPLQANDKVEDKVP